MATPFGARSKNLIFAPEGLRNPGKCLQWPHLYMTYEKHISKLLTLGVIDEKLNFRGCEAKTLLACCIFWMRKPLTHLSWILAWMDFKVHGTNIDRKTIDPGWANCPNGHALLRQAKILFSLLKVVETILTHFYCRNSLYDFWSNICSKVLILGVIDKKLIFRGCRAKILLACCIWEWYRFIYHENWHKYTSESKEQII